MTPTQAEPTNQKKRPNKYAELGRQLLNDDFRKEVYYILNSYQKQSRGEAYNQLGELSDRLGLLGKGINDTILDVVSDHPEEFARDLKHVPGDKEKRELRLLNARFNAFYIGIIGSFAEEWRSWKIEPFYDPELEDIVLRFIADRRDGNKVVWMDDAQSMLHVIGDLLEDLLNQRASMKKAQLNTVEKRLDRIRKLINKPVNKAKQ